MAVGNPTGVVNLHVDGDGTAAASAVLEPGGPPVSFGPAAGLPEAWTMVQPGPCGEASAAGMPAPSAPPPSAPPPDLGTPVAQSQAEAHAAGDAAGQDLVLSSSPDGFLRAVCETAAKHAAEAARRDWTTWQAAMAAAAVSAPGQAASSSDGPGIDCSRILYVPVTVTGPADVPLHKHKHMMEALEDEIGHLLDRNRALEAQLLTNSAAEGVFYEAKADQLKNSIASLEKELKDARDACADLQQHLSKILTESEDARWPAGPGPVWVGKSPHAACYHSSARCGGLKSPGKYEPCPNCCGRVTRK